MTGRAPVLALACLLPSLASAQPAADREPADPPPEARATDERPAPGAIARFLAGGAIGLGLHEGGHLLSAVVFDADPGIGRVEFGPIPFFAITHQAVSPAREYTIAASGFWMQHASSEWILTSRPRLRETDSPLAKGLLAFNVLASAAYASAAFGRFGPDQRDTRAMAEALGVGEPWVGAMVLAPAALDLWRYARPESAWARWASRAMKVGAVVVVFRARR